MNASDISLFDVSSVKAENRKTSTCNHGRTKPSRIPNWRHSVPDSEPWMGALKANLASHKYEGASVQALF